MAIQALKLAFDGESLQQELLGAFLNQSDNLIFAKDNDFRILYANDKFLNLYPPEQRDSIIGTTTAENFSETQARIFFAEDRKALEEGRAQLIEQITDFTGHTRTFQTQKVRYYDKNGQPCMLGICTDISQMALREQQLAEANMSLENFARTAAHDLRSPLGTIMFSLDMLRMDKETTLSSNANNYIHMMQTCVKGLAEQIVGLLENQDKKNTDPDQFASCDIKIVFEEAKFNLSKSIQDSNASVLSSELPTIYANHHLFRQLVQNLIENSLKYRSDETPIIILRCKPQGADYLFSLEDNGIGIAEQDKDRVFGIYERALNANVAGHGIGLSLCQKIVETHEGRIWFDDEKRSRGSKINFLIPDLHDKTRRA